MKDFATRTPATKVASSEPGKGPALVDNRATAVTQRKMQATIANSPRQAAPRPQAPVQLAAPRPNRTGLPDKLKAGVESLSGYSLDDVKVHYNSAKPAELQAHAYAQGTDIHVAPGQEQHLPHEAWHVVQQKQGRVRATRQLKGTVINDEAVLEREANAMGVKSLSQASPIAQLRGASLPVVAIVQRTVASDLATAATTWGEVKTHTDEATNTVLPTFAERIKEKDNAKAAQGLSQWTRAHLVSVKASFAELNTAASSDTMGNRHGGEQVTAILGSSAKLMPDFIISSSRVDVSGENKTSQSDSQNEIDKLVMKAHMQLGLERAASTDVRRAVIRIENAANPWPYTPTTLPPVKPSPLELGEQAKTRTLRHSAGPASGIQVHVHSALFGNFTFFFI